MNYVDRDAASAAWQDFRCGSMTYDGHKGTDIAVRDRKAMEQGVPVLAAADGVVLRLRNDVADHNGEADAMGAAKQSGTECGNGVIIAHEDDWTTQYCHMRADSIIVKPGQTVRAGDRLGMVGQSGMAQFPHLHFGIMQGDVRLDPFTGEDMASSSSCGAAAKASMWKTQIPYDPAMFTAAGFSPKPPVFEELLKDASSPQTISLSAPALAFWFLLHGARAGDGIDVGGIHGSKLPLVAGLGAPADGASGCRG